MQVSLCGVKGGGGADVGFCVGVGLDGGIEVGGAS